jgi:hypothetical protein
MNLIFTSIFGVECVVKVYGLGVKGYCGDNFNIFDGIVVLLSIIEIAIEKITDNATEMAAVSTCDEATGTGDCEDVNKSSGTSAISAFRAIRIFRTFRV